MQTWADNLVTFLLIGVRGWNGEVEILFGIAATGIDVINGQRAAGYFTLRDI